jgi:hypothetical protein
MNRIVVRRVGAYSHAWVCEECGQVGMSLNGGPAPINLRYAREKHRCRYVKSRECGPPRQRT